MIKYEHSNDKTCVTSSISIHFRYMLTVILFFYRTVFVYNLLNIFGFFDIVDFSFILKLMTFGRNTRTHDWGVQVV